MPKKNNGKPCEVVEETPLLTKCLGNGIRRYPDCYEDCILQDESKCPNAKHPPASPLPVDNGRLQETIGRIVKVLFAWRDTGKLYISDTEFNSMAYEINAIFEAQRDLTASLKDGEIAEMKAQLQSVREQRDAAGDREKWYQNDIAKLRATHKAEVERIQKLVNEALGISSERSPRWRTLVLKLEEISQALKASVEGKP